MTRSLAIMAFVLCFCCGAAAAADKLSDPKLEARAVALQKELRCLVCQGESLDESNAPLAADLRRLIRERIVAGDTDAGITNYLVARYGDFILMKPPVDRDTYLLWFGPVGLLVFGGAIAGLVGWRARGRFLTEAGGSSRIAKNGIEDVEMLQTFNDMNRNG
jgi:cytochrome c-type biogenesis protein CcmH